MKINQTYRASGSVSVKEVAALEHEAADLQTSTSVSKEKGLTWHVMTYDPMKPAALVALRLAPAVPGFARAELPEVLRRPRHDVLEQLEGNAAERLTCDTGQPHGTESDTWSGWQ